MSGGKTSPKCYSLALADEEQSSESPRSSAMASLACSKPKRKTVYVALGILLAFIVFISVLATQLRLKGSDDCPSGAVCDWKAVPSSEFLKDARCPDICSTRSCINAAIYSMKRIDPSQDPCNDFYKFACGAYTEPSVDNGDSSVRELERGYISDLKDVLENIPTNGTGMKGSALRFAKAFYSNCLLVNTADLESRTTRFLKELFHRDGKLPWPLLNKDVPSSANNKLELSLAFLSSLSNNPLFQTELIHRSSSKWLIEVDIPMFGQLKHIYEDTEDGENRTEVYLKAMSYALEIMGVDNATRIRTVQDIAAFEKKVVEAGWVASIGPTPIDQQDHKYSCEETTARLRALNWCSFVSRFLPLLGISPSLPALFHVKSIQYFQALNKIIERTRTSDLINYLNVKFLMTFQPYLTDRFQYYHYLDDDVFRKLTIYRSSSDHWQKCVLLTAEQMWPVLHDRYVSTKFDEQKREKAEEMITVMNSTMSAVFKELKWMDKEGKEALIEEFNNRKYVITLEKLIPSQDDIDQLFFMMSVEQRPLIEDALDLMKLKSKMAFSSKINYVLFKTSDIFFVDNYLSPSLDSHIYGYRYFRFPNLDFDRPKYLDYSTLGQVIMLPMSRTIMHYVYLEKNRGKTNVLDERNECITDHFSRYGSTDAENDTLGGYSNLFDALTLESTFKAYERKLKKQGEEKGLPGLPLSNRQLFFLFYAQMHCESGTLTDYDPYTGERFTPADVRINGMLSQSPHFGKAFRCSKESPLNPSTRCCLLSSKETDGDCV